MGKNMDFNKFNEEFKKMVSFERKESLKYSLTSKLLELTEKYNILGETNDVLGIRRMLSDPSIPSEVRCEFSYGLFGYRDILDVLDQIAKCYKKNASNDDIIVFARELINCLKELKIYVLEDEESFEKNDNKDSNSNRENLLEIIVAINKLEFFTTDLLCSVGDIESTLKGDFKDSDKREILFKNLEIIEKKLSQLEYGSLAVIKNYFDDYEREKELLARRLKEACEDNNYLYAYIYDGEFEGETYWDKLDNVFKKFEEYGSNRNVLIEKFSEYVNSDKFIKDQAKNPKETSKIKYLIVKICKVRDDYYRYKPFLEKLNLEIKKREDQIVSSILFLSNDMEREEKFGVLHSFLLSGLNNTTSTSIREKKFPSVDEYDNYVEKAIEKLKTNETIVNMISAGETLANKIDNGFENSNKSKSVKMDYTFLVTSQIKAIERIIKEAVLKYCTGEDIGASGTDRFLVPEKSRLDDLDDSISNEKKYNLLTPGNMNFFLNAQLKRDNNLFEDEYKYNSENSIFHAKNPNGDKFYVHFIKKIRNGNFHTDLIQSIEEANKYRIEIAFWMLCVLSEIKGL